MNSPHVSLTPSALPDDLEDAFEGPLDGSDEAFMQFIQHLADVDGPEAQNGTATAALAGIQESSRLDIDMPERHCTSSKQPGQLLPASTGAGIQHTADRWPAAPLQSASGTYVLAQQGCQSQTAATEEGISTAIQQQVQTFTALWHQDANLSTQQTEFYPTDDRQQPILLPANGSAPAWPTCVPSPGEEVVESATQSAQQEGQVQRRRRQRTAQTEEQKQEKLKDKNRRGQARYREKVKIEMQALRAQISETEASLLVAGRRCRALRHLRHSIRARTLTPLPQPQARTTSTRPGHAFPPTKYQYNQLPDMQPHTHGDCNDSGLDAHVCPHERKCPSATSSLNQMVPLWRRRRREAVFMERQEENLKPICDFKMCASACFRLHGCCLWSCEIVVHVRGMPLTSALQYSGIGYEDIVPYIPQHLSGLQSSDTSTISSSSAAHPYAIAAAIQDYQHAVCAAAQQQLKDVCWFNQIPYQVQPGLNMSHSPGACSPECCLSLSVSMTALGCESLFLLLEHELLEASKCSDYVPQPHIVLTSSHMLPVLTTLCRPSQRHTIRNASPSALENLNLKSLLVPPAPQKNSHDSLRCGCGKAFVRCGVNQRFPAEKAISVIFRKLLQKHRPLLSLGVWRAVCLASMHVVYTSLDEFMLKICREKCTAQNASSDSSSKSNSHTQGDSTDDVLVVEGVATGAKQSQQAQEDERSCMVEEEEGVMSMNAACAEASAEEDSEGAMGKMNWGELDGAIVAVLQKLLEVFYDTLTESDTSQEAAFMHGVDDLQARMHVNASFCSVTYTLMQQFAPVTLARMCVMHTPQDIVRAERQQLKLFEYLCFAPDQKVLMADKWRAWVRCRKLLDGQLAAALEKLNTLCPALPDDLMQLLDAFSTEDVCMEDGSSMDGVDMGDARSPSKTEYCDEEDSQGAEGDTFLQPALVVDPRYLTAMPPRLTGDSACSHPPSDYVNSKKPASKASKNMPEHSFNSCSKPHSSQPADLHCSNLNSKVTLVRVAVAANGKPAASTVLPSAMGNIASVASDSCAPNVRFERNSSKCEKLCNGASCPEDNNVEASDDASRNEQCSDLNVSELLGSNGERMRDLGDALEGLRDVQQTDFLLKHECVAMVMRSSLLTEVQAARMMAARVELRSNTTDVLRLFQAAAQQEQWEALFGSLRL